MPLRVSTWNVNGLRAAGRKGLNRFLRRLRPDVIMLQEIRCTKAQAKGLWKPPSTLRMDWHPAERLAHQPAGVEGKDDIVIAFGAKLLGQKLAMAG